MQRDVERRREAVREVARDAVPLRPIEFLVLAVLLDGPTHGYGLVDEIEARTGGAVSPRPGDLYRVLFRLQERGWLERSGPPDEGGMPGKSDARGRNARGRGDAPDRSEERRRTDYRITEAGRRVVAAEAEVMGAVSAGVLRRLAETGESA